MRLVDQILQTVIHQLIVDERLLLVEGATDTELVAEVIARFKRAPASAQLGPYFAKVLVESPLVDELFADNKELVALFNQTPE